MPSFNRKMEFQWFIKHFKHLMTFFVTPKSAKVSIFLCDQNFKWIFVWIGFWIWSCTWVLRFLLFSRHSEINEHILPLCVSFQTIWRLGWPNVLSKLDFILVEISLDFSEQKISKFHENSELNLEFRSYTKKFCLILTLIVILHYSTNLVYLNFYR